MGGSKKRRRSRFGDEVEQVYVCPKCSWPYESSEPSSRKVKLHKSVCGGLEGYPLLTNSAGNDDYCNKLPADVLLEVLKKLPVKSLLRFKAACKPWNSHISSSSFISGYQKSRLSNNVLLGYKGMAFSSLFVSYTDDDSFPDHVTRTHMFVPPRVKEANSGVLGGINGLFCFADYTEPERPPAVVIWNPLMRKASVDTQPKVLSRHTYFLGFGVCSRTNNPKVVTLSDDSMGEMRSYVRFQFDTLLERVQVFSVRSAIWRKPFGKLLTVAPERLIIHFTQHVVTSKCMFWLGQDETEVVPDGVGHPFLIISFDITRERFSVIRLPPDLANNEHKMLRLSKRRDSLILKKWDKKDRNHGVWVMVSNEDEIRFQKLFTMNCPETSELLMFRMNDEPIIQNFNDTRAVDVVCYETESRLVRGSFYPLFKIPFPQLQFHDNTILASSYSETLFLSSNNTYSKHRLLMIYRGTGSESVSECVSFMDEETKPDEGRQLALPISFCPASCIISGSSHGLFCFQSFSPEGVPSITLWNPAFGLSVGIDLSGDNLERDKKAFNTVFGFGVCPQTMEPKVVMIKYNNHLEESNQVQVYSLTSGAWRSPHRSEPLPRKAIEFGQMDGHVVTYESIFWLAHERSRYVIISFDLEKEEFGEINLPGSLASSASLRLFNRGGALVLVGTDGKAWVRQGTGQKPFTELFTVDTPPKRSRVVGFRTSDEPVILTGDNRDICVYEPRSRNLSRRINAGKKGEELAVDFMGAYIETNLLIGDSECDIEQAQR